MVSVQQSTEQRLIACTTTPPHRRPLNAVFHLNQRKKKAGKLGKRKGPLIVSMSGSRAQQLIEGQAIDMKATPATTGCRLQTIYAPSDKPQKPTKIPTTPANL